MSEDRPSVAPDVYVARSPKIAARMLGDELMIVSSRDSSLITLNETAAAIWNAADGQTQLQRIVETQICAEFDAEPTQALRDAQELVSDLHDYGVLIISDAPIAPAP